MVVGYVWGVVNLRADYGTSGSLRAFARLAYYRSVRVFRERKSAPGDDAPAHKGAAYTPLARADIIRFVYARKRRSRFEFGYFSFKCREIAREPASCIRKTMKI